MRRFTLLFAVLSLLIFSTPAFADVEDLAVGINGVATAGADIVLGGFNGAEDAFDLGPLTPFTSRVQGIVIGTITALHRAGTGAFDAATFMFTDTVGGAYSPAPIFNLFGLADGKIVPLQPVAAVE